MTSFTRKVIQGRRITIPGVVAEVEDIEIGDIVEVEVKKVQKQ